MFDKIYFPLDLALFADLNVQTTVLNAGGNDLSAEMKTYYERRLIDNAEPNLVHDQFGGKYPIPKGGGNTLQVGSGDLGYPFVMDGPLSVSGVVSCVEVVTSSDERKKFDITQISDDAARTIITSLRPVTFRYVTGDIDQKHYGFIAQEVPEDMRRKAADGYLALNYSEIIAPLVKTVQQQERRITALEERLAKLEVG